MQTKVFNWNELLCLSPEVTRDEIFTVVVADSKHGKVNEIFFTTHSDDPPDFGKYIVQKYPEYAEQAIKIINDWVNSLK